MDRSVALYLLFVCVHVDGADWAECRMNYLIPNPLKLMETNEATFVLPQDVPLPLQDAVESLYQVIDNTSKVSRNAQKMLHFIARCIDIISELKDSISTSPSDLEDMMDLMDSVGKLDTSVNSGLVHGDQPPTLHI